MVNEGAAWRNRTNDNKKRHSDKDESNFPYHPPGLYNSPLWRPCTSHFFFSSEIATLIKTTEFPPVCGHSPWQIDLSKRPSATWRRSKFCRAEQTRAMKIKCWTAQKDMAQNNSTSRLEILLVEAHFGTDSREVFQESINIPRPRIIILRIICSNVQ